MGNGQLGIYYAVKINFEPRVAPVFLTKPMSSSFLRYSIAEVTDTLISFAIYEAVAIFFVLNISNACLGDNARRPL